MVFNFLHSLKSSSTKTVNKEEIIDSLVDFIGAVESGNLAKNIDN